MDESSLWSIFERGEDGWTGTPPNVQMSPILPLNGRVGDGAARKWWEECPVDSGREK